MKILKEISTLIKKTTPFFCRGLFCQFFRSQASGNGTGFFYVLSNNGFFEIKAFKARVRVLFPEKDHFTLKENMIEEDARKTELSPGQVATLGIDHGTSFFLWMPREYDFRSPDVELEMSYVLCFRFTLSSSLRFTSWTIPFWRRRMFYRRSVMQALPSQKED